MCHFGQFWVLGVNYCLKVLEQNNSVCHRYFQLGTQVLESMKGYLEELVVELQQVGIIIYGMVFVLLIHCNL